MVGRPAMLPTWVGGRSSYVLQYLTLVTVFRGRERGACISASGTALAEFALRSKKQKLYCSSYPSTRALFVSMTAVISCSEPSTHDKHNAGL